MTKWGSFSPRAKEKETTRIILLSQYKSAPITGPVSLWFMFCFEPVKSTSKKSREKMLKGETFHVKKPDCSNLIKFAEDCLKGIVIRDDSQVVYVSGRKVYSEKSETRIIVIPLEE